MSRPSRSLPPVDADTDHDLDADSAHDDAPAPNVVEHELRQIRRTQSSIVKLIERAADRDDERDDREKEKDALFLRLTEAVEKLASDTGVVRIVIDRGSTLAERLLDPPTLAGATKFVLACALFAGVIVGAEMTGLGLTIRTFATQAVETMAADTGTPEIPQGPRPAP